MTKFKTVYICQQCGVETPKWSGQCPNCQAWNSLVEEVVEKKTRGTKGSTSTRGGIAQVVSLAEVEAGNKGESGRKTTGLSEFDRVLGGGIVSGSVVLVAGEPGIGKSTLLTQLAMKVGGENLKHETLRHSSGQARNTKQYLNSKGINEKTNTEVSDLAPKVLYVCGEESPSQVNLRVRRLLGMTNDKCQMTNIKLLAETDVDVIVQAASQEKPSLMIVDSIQTLFTQDLSGMAGSVGQVRESANRLIGLAKSTHMAIMLVGHVTKEGNVAGPKVLEHMVDTVLVLEGERTGMWRILKTQKNRFGATDEVGVFLMEESGLTDVANPSSAFLAETSQGVAGSAVAALLEGTRVMLVEIQALVVSSQLAMPRRVSQGIVPTKLQLIAAILQKHARLPLGDKDIFVNVAGGLKINEPAVDVAIAVAIASSLLNKSVEARAVFAGELGLLGEVRQVSYLDKRIKEAKRLGYGAAYTAKFQANLRRMLDELGMRGGKREKS